MTADTPHPRKALGRGLAALIPSAPTPSNQSSSLRHLGITRVHPNPAQPRKHFDPDQLDELAASIREQGVLQPIIVRQSKDAYEIIAGERRWRAACKAGLQQIPAIVKDVTPSEALQIALVENLQRTDLDPLEEAQAFRQLIKEHGQTQEQVAQAVGKSRTSITNSLRLLRLPEAVLSMLADGRLTAGHARALMTLNSASDIIKLAKDTIDRGASVRETEAIARRLRRSTAKAASVTRSAAEINVEERLMKVLGTKVRLRNRSGRGRVEIFFHSLEQLDALLAKIETSSSMYV